MRTPSDNNIHSFSKGEIKAYIIVWRIPQLRGRNSREEEKDPTCTLHHTIVVSNYGSYCTGEVVNTR